MNSIFTNPYKYRQSESKGDLENYLTEILAGVLKIDKPFLVDLLDEIGCNEINGRSIEIRTQTYYVLDERMVRPDLQITVEDDIIILFENKVGAQERVGQLDDYSRILTTQDRFEKKYLVYLSRYLEYKSISESEVEFKELQWHHIAKLSKQFGPFALELNKFLTDKKLDMEGNLSYLDALVIENMGDVFEKLDVILNAAHNYHKREDIMNVRMDRGRGRESIKKYGYLISGVWKEVELVMGFINNPVELVYRIQGKSIPEYISSNLLGKGWVQSVNEDKIEQLDKRKKLSNFMTQDGDEMGLMISFLKEAVDELRGNLSK